LTSFSNVFGRALYIRLTEHFYSNKLLVGNQFGYRKGIATEDVVFKLTDEILNNLINRTMAGGILFDLEKAFDSVNHTTPLTLNDLYISRTASPLNSQTTYIYTRCKLCVEWINFVHSYSVLQCFRTLEGQAFIQEP